jgi:hypothetical protein
MKQNHLGVMRTLGTLGFFTYRGDRSDKCLAKPLILACKMGNVQAVGVVLKYTTKCWTQLKPSSTRFDLEPTINIIKSHLYSVSNADQSNEKWHRWKILRIVSSVLLRIEHQDPRFQPRDVSIADLLYIKDCGDVMDALLFSAVSFYPPKHQIARMLLQYGRHSNASLYTAKSVLDRWRRIGGIETTEDIQEYDVTSGLLVERIQQGRP